MSGGALDYVYEDVEQAIGGGVYSVNAQQEALVRDIAQLLHDIEWSASGDYAPDHWRGTLAEFCAEWEGGSPPADRLNSESQHFESFYHCLECRQVFYLEETDEKVTERCPNCGPGTQFKITEADDAF
jgi:DNA-directed RNA polymerase subunit RPC12/RpoP